MAGRWVCLALLGSIVRGLEGEEAILVSSTEDFGDSSVFCVYNLTLESGRKVAVAEAGPGARSQGPGRRAARLVQDGWLVQYRETGEATRLAPRPGGTEGAAAVQYGDSVCLVGGAREGTASAGVHCWNPLARGEDSWVALPSMLRPRFRPGAVVMDGKLYVAGGYDPVSHTFLREAEVFDDVQAAWYRLPSLAEGRAGLGLAGLGGRLYAVGGWRGHNYLREMEVYDPLANSWAAGPSLQERRGKLGLLAIGSPARLYAVAGVSGFRQTDQLGTVERLSNTGDSWEMLKGEVLGVRGPVTVAGVAG